MTDNPMDRLARLGNLMKETAEAQGLELRHFAPHLDLEGSGVHMLQFVFALPASVLEADIENEPQDEYTDILAGIEAATKNAEKEAFEAMRQAEEDEKAERAKERLLEMRNKLKRDGGIFDDEEYG